MIYQRYFKNGQKLLLTALDLPDQEKGRTELLSSVMDGGDADTFIVSLPYSDDATEQYPFEAGMPFEISSEALGLGIRVTASFERRVDGRRIAMKINSDLQMFQRRNQPRIDCKLGIRFTRGQGTLKTLRNTWEKNIQVLKNPNAPINLEGFNTCQVNISAGGIRFALRPPAEVADLCLMLINLNDEKPPICTVAEIVWTQPEEEESIIVSGMRFINILETDQKRIDQFISRNS